MTVPNQFANVTTSIPLSQLDANFNTPITLGNTAIQLGNTVTTLNNMTLANVTVSSGNVTITNVSVTTANVTTANIATAQIANVTVSGTSTFAAGSNTAPSITTSGDTNTGIFFPAADTVAIGTGGTERVRVDSAGNTGFGVTPSAWRSNYRAVQVGNAGQLVGRTDANQLYAGSNWFVNSSNQDIYQNNGNATLYAQNSGSHIWYNAPSGTAGAQITFTTAMVLDANGNLGLNVTPNAWRAVDDVLQVGQGFFGGLATSSSTRRSLMGSNYYTNASGQDIYVANGEATLYQQNNGTHTFYSAASGTAGNVVTLTSILDVRLGKALALQGGAVDITGTGIAFPAAVNPSSDANTLDDYEEGVFEPIAIGSGVAGTGTYTLQAGRYTKIGRVCFFQFTIGWSAFTGTGDLNIGGLPFTSLGADGEAVAGQSAATIGYISGLSFTNPPRLYIPLNNTILVFTQTTTGGIVSGIPVDTAVNEIIVNGHYIVA